MRIRNSSSDMKELEDTRSETRRVLDLRFSIWDRLNNSLEEEAGSPIGSPRYNSCATPLGDFFGDGAYAWLSCGPRFAVIDVKTGASICFWTFRDRVTCVSPFPSQPGQLPMLLVGLDNGASKLRDSHGLICVFDCSTTQVLRAVRMPAGVEQVCVVIGGAEWEDFGDERIHNFPVENSGLACVALRNLDHLMIDLRRSSWDGPDAESIADEASPAELDFSPNNESATLKHNRFGREKHVAYNLMNSRVEQYIGFSRDKYESSSFYQESLTSSMICSRKIGCLVSGCLGRIIIWQMDGVVRWVSPPTGESVSITNLALLEPTDDPRPFCYLWASHQEESSRRPPVLRMYAMLFERKFADKGSNAYLKLKDDPSQHFELELDEGDRVASLESIVRESNPEQTETGNKRGEENLLLISLDSRTLLFDLNQWYKEQMPRTLGDSQNANAFLACYRTSQDTRTRVDEGIVNSSYVPRSLKEFRSHGSSPTEELFYPNSLCLEWIELGSGRLTFRSTRGVQNELLRDLSLAGPVILLEPTETYHRCLAAGLLSPSTECSFNSGKDAQRDALLSLCLEQYWSSFLFRCAKEWSDGSASYLFQAFLRWGYQRAVSIKLTADRYCVPLFDGSDTSIGESEVRMLRCLAQQSECISNVMTNLFVDSVDLTKERRSLRRISTYLQVLLWFYDVGLLPETQKIDDAAAPQLSFSLKIPYPFVRLATIYKEKREQFSALSPKKKRDNEEDLFIDELLTRECPSLKLRWEHEGCDDRGEDSEVKRELCLGGNYPPSSLQTLLRSYLTDFHSDDNRETENKHQITTYLLMDLAMLLQESYPESIHKTLVEQLIKYPSAFKLSPSFIQLTQALWRLDHENYEGFLNIMTGQLVADTDVKDWHHKLILRTLIRNNQNKLALVYLRVRKPPLSSLDDQGTAISLTVEHGLPQSAFHRRPPSHYAQLLTRFFRACKAHGRLNDILHLALNPEEEEAFVKFLEDEKSEDMRLLYYLQRCRYTEASNVYPSCLSNTRGNSYRSNKPSSLAIFEAYNATLPSITRKFANNATRRNHDIDPDSRYPRPLSHRNNRCASRDVHETVVRKVKETFLRGDRTQIPFVSAPCSSLRTAPSNVDTNSVLFVERTRKPYGKRCLDEMRNSGDEATNNDNNGEERKRRKTAGTNDTPDACGSKELGMSMVFDTPLIKRKNQIMNARSTPTERPHSILKIRQMIRDSASTSIVERAAEAPIVKIAAKEKKPRQIRFSIGQQRAEETLDEDDVSDGENSEKNLAQGDAHEESDETEKSLSKCDASEADDDEIDEPFYSPNVSDRLQETAILSDSSYVSRSMSGPRPRPSLRRSTLSSNESSSDLLRRSLMKSRDLSMRVSNDSSIRETNATFENSKILDPPPNFDDPSLLSTSMYSDTILSPDTSFECATSTYETKETNSSIDHFGLSIERTADKIRDTSASTGARERNENLSRFSRSVTVKTTTRTSVIEEYSGDGDEDKNSEILMEVDGFGLDRDSDTRSQNARETNWELDRIAGTRESYVSSISQISATSEVTETGENRCETPEGEVEEDKIEDSMHAREQRDHGDDSVTREISIAKPDENVEEAAAGEDYEDELLALKYDEDEEPEEAFQSLTNSMEVDRSIALSTPEISTAIEDATEKKLSSNNGFYDAPKLEVHEFTITDDESSRSVEGSAMSGSTSVLNVPRDDATPVKEINEETHDGASNITDDESEASRDSSIFTTSRRGSTKDFLQEKNLQTSRRNAKEADESSHSSSIFARVTKEYLPEQTDSRIDEIPNEAANSSWDSTIFARKNREASETNANETSSSIAETLTSNEGKDSGKNEFSAEGSPVTRKSSRISKIGSFTPRRDSEVAETTPSRMTRSRRASSVVQESLASPAPESPSLKTRVPKVGRLRRGGSLMKDLFANSDDDPSRVESSEAEEPPDPPPTKKGRLRRSTSLAKEIFATRTSSTRETPKDDELPIRRSARRAASVQKETPEASSSPKPRTRASSKASLIEDTANDETLTEVKKNTREKRGSSMSKEVKEAPIAPRRLTRASSLVKEIPESGEDVAEATTKRPTRRRGSSVPKETPTETIARAPSQRTRRGGSVAKEIIPEESNDSAEESKHISTRGKTNEASPTSGGRTRLLSITSIPEENDDEVFDDSSRAKPTTGERKRVATARERRAVSVDASLTDVKRRTRASSIKSAISEDPIEEENSDSELAPSTRNATTRKATTRRKRTASGSSAKDLADNADAEKLPRRRTRKLSQRSNESTTTFKFSPPEIVHGAPGDDEKEPDEVPFLGFSEPRFGRSKYPTPNQPQN